MSKKKESPEINASSLADIAFLLLIFFLVATTMSTDTGLARMLPPILPNTNDDVPPIKERNVFQVMLNYKNQLLVEGEWCEIGQLKDKAKEFIANPKDEATLPEKAETEIPLIGNYMVSKGVISLQNDRGSQYQAYLQVQNELQAAYNELRDELAKTKFHHAYADCTDEEQDAIKKVYPQRISEAEPKDYKKK
ncbi:MAG: biopolymer transporter ExbD [Bacteroidales bacterium]|jgi:biopolymer transport protein ExbD|nr:biopolymer transporter ExbD [Bacteroidales bacterium]MBP5418633.1 biopolymer transporter ExbD [Bacteroidales bacterium]MCR5696304.1 biopolymer transporter ExbD [Marinilabiliaceae bacterium]